MSVAIITGSAGLIGSEATTFFAEQGLDMVGIDNDRHQTIVARELQWTYSEQNRMGNPIWWVSDNSKFSQHYPNWKLKYNVPQILQEIYEFNYERWKKGAL